jgi:hypothetical protein
MFGKMVPRLVEPGASFFGDIGSGFDGGVVLLGKVHDDGSDRSAPLEEFSFFLIFLPFDTPTVVLASLQGSHQQARHTIRSKDQ